MVVECAVLSAVANESADDSGRYERRELRSLLTKAMSTATLR